MYQNPNAIYHKFTEGLYWLFGGTEKYGIAL